jgi:phosphatidate cytidylyltransferase
LALPLASALANDPLRFLERNAKLQWGIMVCIYGMSHVPALLLLSFPGYDNRNAFLVFFLVHGGADLHGDAALRFAPAAATAPVAPAISQSFQLAQLVPAAWRWAAWWAPCWPASHPGCRVPRLRQPSSRALQGRWATL